MTINTTNVKELLANDDLIQLEFIYSWKTKKYWRLLQALTIQLTTGQIIEIPKGFVTDLSSVPRPLWGIAPPFGDFLLAAIIHDFLYTGNVGTRPVADREMFRWSTILNDNKVDNRIRFIAVRIFGGSYWNHNTNWGKPAA